MDEPLPKVTPYLLKRAATMCSQRLAREFAAELGSRSPVNRARLRDAFLEAARTNHAELRAPSLEYFTPPPSLFAEEAAVFRQAAGWYVQLFGDRAVEVHLHDCDTPTVSARRALRIGGWVDLTVVDADGRPELRQLGLWHRNTPHDVLDSEAIRLALLRLTRWVGERAVRVCSADLVHGDLRERSVDVATALPALVEWFDERVELVRGRVADPVPTPGADCGTCRHTATCRAHRGARGSWPRGDLRPEIVTLSPSSLERWLRCRRLWRTTDLLGLPASDEPSAPDHGLFVHDLLRLIHEQGSCRDAAHVDDTLVANGVEGPGLIRDEIEAHSRRCPMDAAPIGHELDIARFHRLPLPLFLATARLDALWQHGDVLDARDYKTGSLHVHRVADDPRARLQAWVLAPLAEARGLRLRLRYEYLSPDVDDDPEPFEPDDDDLAAIDEELRQVVADIWGEQTFSGVADAGTCGVCRYRSICPDSRAPGEPSWPVVELDGETEKLDA